MVIVLVMIIAVGRIMIFLSFLFVFLCVFLNSILSYTLLCKLAMVSFPLEIAEYSALCLLTRSCKGSIEFLKEFGKAYLC